MPSCLSRVIALSVTVPVLRPQDSPPVRRPTPPRAATPPRPASPPPVQAAAPPSPPQSHTFEAATNGGAAVGAESGGSPRAAGGGEDDLAAAMRDLGFSPSLAVDAAPPAEADPVDIDPGAAAAAHAPSVPQAAPDPPEAAAPAPDPALSPAAAPAAKKKKKKPAAPASGGEGAGREMDTKAFAYKVTAGEQPVPVLVLADSQAGQWRQSAQSVSSAYNGLVGASGTGGPGAEGEARGRPGGGRVGRSSTLANPRARVLGALSPRGIGTGSLFDEGDGLSASGAEAEDPRSLSPPVARRARGAGRGSRSTSVPAGARAGLLENNVLALSTGSVEERASAARRICARAKSTEQLRQLVDAGAVESVGRLLAEPRGMAAAVDALLPLCALVGGAERSPEAQAVLRDFCAEVAPTPPSLLLPLPVSLLCTHFLPP